MNLYFLQGLSRKQSRWTKMSDLIALIHSENNPDGSIRLERIPHRSGGREAAKWTHPALPAGQPAPRPTCQPPRRNVGSLPPPRLHLCRPLSRFDPRAHVGCSSLYILAPAKPLRHQVILEDRNHNHSLSSTIF